MRRHYGRKVEDELQRGRKRGITRSEIERGYLFITTAKYADEFLNTDNFHLTFDELVLENKRLDSFGRVYVGKSFMRQFSLGHRIVIRTVSEGQISVESI